ncbi:hypothetical protein [Chitinophaga rhizosphaerae]|uniref:hypothetical protein n=1 Tax=Chitinophaga rhizosphaerae TaxID=1864947 RepID=UPI000F80FF48|nr:hypothetical protein [Chitinophaga rhizosphaerae]
MKKTKLNYTVYYGPVLIAAILYGIYFYGTYNGVRYCNCKATEDWKPDGNQQSSRSHGGPRFYHK